MGNNLALNAYITASSYVDPYVPYRAVNGITSDPTSRWLCAALPGWLSLDLKKSSWIGQWTVKSPGNQAGWPVDYCMTSFRLESSLDGTNWTIVDSVTGNNSNLFTRVLPSPVCARYFRLYVPGGGGLKANRAAASIMELELIEADAAVLSSLEIKDNNGNDAALTPGFYPDTFIYVSNVGFDSDWITVIPAASKATAVITVNGQGLTDGKATVEMTNGSNTVEIKVTSADGVTVTYQVAVTRASSPYLTSVKLAGLRFSVFEKTTYSYDLSTSRLTETAVIPASEDPEAVVEITLNDVVYSSGQQIPLNEGLNPINVTVTSKTGDDSRNYIFNINKST